MRLGHADGEDAIAGHDARQDALADRRRRIGGDHARLHPGLAESRHRRHVTDLGDLLEHERRVEHRQAEPAIFFRHRHPEHTDLGKLAHIGPREGPVHVLLRVGLEFRLREVADRGNDALLIVTELEIHGTSPSCRVSGQLFH
jgi:hypothetical protein